MDYLFRDQQKGRFRSSFTVWERRCKKMWLFQDCMALVPTMLFLDLTKRALGGITFIGKKRRQYRSHPMTLHTETQDGIMLINSCVSMSRVMMCHAFKTNQVNFQTRIWPLGMWMNLIFRFHFSICAPSWQWEFVPTTASKLPKVNDHNDRKFSSTYMKSVHSWNVNISSEES